MTRGRLRSLSHDFARDIDEDDERIDEIMGWPLWQQLERDGIRYEALEYERSDDRTGGWVGDEITGYDLVPDRWHTGLQCMRVAKGDAREFKRLYEEEPASEVLWLYAMKIAAEYEYTPTDQTEPEKVYINQVYESRKNRNQTEGDSLDE